MEVAWLPADENEQLPAIVAQVLATSPDDSDAATVALLGAENAARRLLEAPPDWGCSYKPGWWQLLIVDGEAIGFVLPVIYDEEETVRDGLDMGTIFHMGVISEHRGKGYGRLLLRAATRTLLAHGVWRIFCDTAENNAPMIELFQSEGWHRLEPRQRTISPSVNP